MWQPEGRAAWERSYKVIRDVWESVCRGRLRGGVHAGETAELASRTLADSATAMFSATANCLSARQSLLATAPTNFALTDDDVLEAARMRLELEARQVNLLGDCILAALAIHLGGTTSVDVVTDDGVDQWTSGPADDPTTVPPPSSFYPTSTTIPHVATHAEEGAAAEALPRRTTLRLLAERALSRNGVPCSIDRDDAEVIAILGSLANSTCAVGPGEVSILLSSIRRVLGANAWGAAVKILYGAWGPAGWCKRPVCLVVDGTFGSGTVAEVLAQVLPQAHTINVMDSSDWSSAVSAMEAVSADSSCATCCCFVLHVGGGHCVTRHQVRRLCDVVDAANCRGTRRICLLIHAEVDVTDDHVAIPEWALGGAIPSLILFEPPLGGKDPNESMRDLRPFVLNILLRTLLPRKEAALWQSVQAQSWVDASSDVLSNVERFKCTSKAARQGVVQRLNELRRLRELSSSGDRWLACRSAYLPLVDTVSWIALVMQSVVAERPCLAARGATDRWPSNVRRLVALVREVVTEKSSMFSSWSTSELPAFRPGWRPIATSQPPAMDADDSVVAQLSSDAGAIASQLLVRVLQVSPAGHRCDPFVGAFLCHASRGMLRAPVPPPCPGGSQRTTSPSPRCQQDLLAYGVTPRQLLAQWCRNGPRRENDDGTLHEGATRAIAFLRSLPICLTLTDDANNPADLSEFIGRGDEICSRRDATVDSTNQMIGDLVSSLLTDASGETSQAGAQSEAASSLTQALLATLEDFLTAVPQYVASRPKVVSRLHSLLRHDSCTVLAAAEALCTSFANADGLARLQLCTQLRDLRAAVSKLQSLLGQSCSLVPAGETAGPLSMADLIVSHIETQWCPVAPALR